MRVRNQLRLFLLAAAMVFLAVGVAWAEAPRNVILMIGDGMGFGQVKAASLYAAGAEGKLPFEAYYRGEMTTHSSDSHRTRDHATDSAAAATALATGHKTTNGRLSVTPDGRPLQTVLEILRDRGKWTGLVTTVPMTHATPAGFAAHSDSRGDYERIAADYFERSRPNVLFGAYWADGKGVTEAKALAAGYVVVRTRDELADFVQANGAKKTPGVFSAQHPSGPSGKRHLESFSPPPHLSGQFAAGQLPYEFDDANRQGAPSITYDTVPHLAEMTSAALEVLARGPDGFFLMVEGGAIDWACHANHLERTVGETLAFAKAFQAVLDWMGRRDDTLVIITADHECGGLWVVQPKGAGEYPDVFWASKGHSGANVPLYALGPGAERFDGVVDNTDLFSVMAGEDPPAPQSQGAVTAEPAAVAP